MKFATGAATHTGLVRANNEDAFLVDTEPTRDDVALRMRLGLLGGEPTLAYELLDEAVIVGDPSEYAFVQ